ncbi:unnamed protein product [Mytilus coruscus]|uniref:G-protein coupled receptors family 2 profile 2 domain-containing protein n=1 Tax=Mytilus coruscus TaxID=42192 RepID=A0A6J8DYF1_MYTCO|nr:unnamed protein product [Mytilus coruscus]
MLSTCPNNTRSTLNELCVKRRSIQQKIQDAPVTSRLTRISFRNKFCALCNNETDYIPWDVDIIYTCNSTSEYLTAEYVVETIVSQKCGAIKYRPESKTHWSRPAVIGGTPAFNIFRIKSYSTLESQCSETQIYDHYRDICRTAGCFISKKFHQKRCVDDSSFNISGYTLPLKLEQVNKSEFIIDKVIANMELQCNRNITYSTPFCLNDVENKNDIILFLLIEAVNQLNRTHFEHDLLEFISGEYMSQYKNTINLNDKKIIADVIYSRNQSISCIPSLYLLLSKILMCRHVVYELNEYNNVDFIVRVNGFVNEFQLYDYHIDTNNDMWLCLEDFNSLEKTKDYINVMYFVIFIICSEVSSLSLLMTLTTYCLFPKLRTGPGKNLISLSVSLLLHHITFILFMTTNETGTFCKILAILMHYFLLSSFGCLSVCAWHMFKIFGTGSIARTMEASRNKHSIRWYVTFS